MRLPFDWWKMSDYPRPFHCLHCEVGWTDRPLCPDCGRHGIAGELPTSRLMHASITATSPKPQTNFSTTIKRTT